jgi:hypothetical protein|tara:strand:- start:77 stop:655 length:579 start_codon:yes stop_codon:yes gene_type:complete
MNLANATGAAFRSDLNNALAAIASNNSNATDPATTFAYQWYVDTGDNTLKIRNAANDGYVNVSTVGGIGTANLGLAPTASPTFTGDVVISSTTALRVPVGTTTERDAYTAANGDIRYNSTNSSFEGYAGGAWGAIGGGATGGGSDAVFYENSLTVTTSYSITANSGAHAVGPLTINSGQTLTVPATSHLVIS